ncbi:MAG: rhodanese-like domain-containing protein, partial [Acidobacteriota bacterium]
ITVDQLDKDLAAKAATPVDCNGDATRKHMGTIPGAILVSDEDKYDASALPTDKAAKLVFYCGGPG